MAIRIRGTSAGTVALCAAETDPMPGDQYIDDAGHYALAAKFAQDWRGQTVDWSYPEEWGEMAKHKLRDAETELTKWLQEEGQR
jgi:hypothetical protein